MFFDNLERFTQRVQAAYAASQADRVLTIAGLISEGPINLWCFLVAGRSDAKATCP